MRGRYWQSSIQLLSIFNAQSKITPLGWVLMSLSLVKHPVKGFINTGNMDVWVC